MSDAASLSVGVLVPQVRLLRDQLRTIDRQLDDALDAFGVADTENEPGQKSEQRDVAILKELPGAGRFVIATLLAEAWPALRERDTRGLRRRCTWP